MENLWIFLFLFLMIYFVPMIIAQRRKCHNRIPIMFLNILLGWTLVGWIIALVWSVRDLTEPSDAEAKKSARFQQWCDDEEEGIFRPDGMVGNTPYRVIPITGEVEALLQGRIVRFNSLSHLRSMVN